MNMTTCPGCNIELPQSDCPSDRYGVASNECWACFNQVLANEITFANHYPEVHRLTVDAYAIQHPPHAQYQEARNIEPRFIKASIQSIGIHLIALHFAFIDNVPLLKIAPKMDALLSKGATFEQLTPPSSLGEYRVDHAVKASNFKEHEDAVWDWARSAFDAWANDHDRIKEWIAKFSHS